MILAYGFRKGPHQKSPTITSQDDNYLPQGRKEKKYNSHVRIKIQTQTDKILINTDFLNEEHCRLPMTLCYVFIKNCTHIFMCGRLHNNRHSVVFSHFPIEASGT